MKKTTVRRLLLDAGFPAALLFFGATLAINLPEDVKADTAVAAPAPATPVSVAVVESREITAWEEFSGRLEAVDRVEVRSRVAGAIQSVHFREGALVKKGDLLVTIDPAPYAATVARTEAHVGAAEARVELTRLELERGRKLVRDPHGSRKAISTSA